MTSISTLSKTRFFDKKLKIVPVGEQRKSLFRINVIVCLSMTWSLSVFACRETKFYLVYRLKQIVILVKHDAALKNTKVIVGKHTETKKK